MKLKVKIYNPLWGLNVAWDWDIDAEYVDLDTAIQQPFRIACVPACFDHKNNFNYQYYPGAREPIDLSNFDLVIISDIEQERYSNIVQWTKESNIKKYVLAIGATHNGNAEYNAETTVLRSWWMYNLMRLNEQDEHMKAEKPYWFDALLGTRKPHRDFVMLSMQKHPLLLDKSIVTYRADFPGEQIDEQTIKIKNSFPDQELAWPYVSPTLNHAWELKDALGKIDGPVQSISPYVPWEIYKNTWYTVICESCYTGDAFFLTEKTTKVMYAKRVFVTFAPCYHLQNLQKLGFQTFGSIMDESYDQEPIDLVRYKKIWAQMLSLTQQDPVEIYNKVKDILEHNKQRLTELEKETTGKMKHILYRNIPRKYISHEQ
jgi:hypothetical protein